jgi:hypothetical protein
MLAPVPVCAADNGKEPLVDQVRTAIERGVEFLRAAEDRNGNWEVGAQSAIMQGGWTSLAMLALLNAGVKPDDPIIERGLKYLRGLAPKYTYVVGLQTMVYAAAGRAEDRERIQENVDWLIQARVFSRNQFVGWSYSQGRGPRADNSNTQYALLGLHEGHRAGAKVRREVWREIQDYYLQTQSDEGGWGYAPQRGGATLTMTTAGLCGLLIAGAELNHGREVLLPNGTARNCGRYQENRPIALALDWIGSRFQVDFRQAVFYNLYGIERAGRLTGQRFLGSHDWYREGCEYLVRRQSADGSWRGGGHDGPAIVATSFALLFLSKGRTPILISKLVHGPREDWNNDHNDARHLAEFSSRELFKRMPLAWQIFDANRGLIENNRDELLSLVGDLLQSPIAYFNGHHAPQFSRTEEELLKEYIDQGGFILAEACCGQEAFDKGFRELMARLFPETPLKPLEANHPIWRSHFVVPPASFKLEGMEVGCKVVVVYSPQDMSCLWEANQPKDPRGELAFRVGANIVAYATGMEPPKPRLTPPEVIRDEPESRRIPRGYLKVIQLRHEGDWQPAPHAMRNLMSQLQDKTRLLVALKTETIHPSQENVLDYKFMYLHGRGTFSYTGGALDNLRANLQTGGLLLADAACGKRAFDDSFRTFIAELFPGKKLEEIPLTDDLFGKELNGEPIVTVRCRRERADGSGRPDAELHDVKPYLEGIKLNNRWVVIYSKYDLGCALERRQSPECLGHDFPSAVRLAGAAVLYALKR